MIYLGSLSYKSWGNGSKLLYFDGESDEKR